MTELRKSCSDLINVKQITCNTWLLMDGLMFVLFYFRAGFSIMCLVYFSPKYDPITGLEIKTKRPVHIQEALQSHFQKGSWQISTRVKHSCDKCITVTDWKSLMHTRDSTVILLCFIYSHTHRQTHTQSHEDEKNCIVDQVSDVICEVTGVNRDLRKWLLL